MELEVRKTYKLYVGGEFIRTESGRYDPIYAADRSKKLRSASAQRPAPRAQRLLLANISRASRKDLREAVRTARSAQPGWASKSAYLKGQILYRMAEMLEGRVASSYFDFSVPEPMGVVGIVAPEEPDLLGLISHLAPVLVSGNSAVVLLSQRYPLASLELAEVLATSDLPAGVANLLSGHKDELVPHLARHMDVLAIADAGGDAAL